MHGHGVFLWHTGDMFEGPCCPFFFSSFLFCYFDVNSMFCSGDWERGRMQGDGHKVWANGDSYEGSWENGEASGFGKKRYNLGDSYEGYYLRGEMHG